MSPRNPSNKIIHLANKIRERSGSGTAGYRKRRKVATRVIAITSGKGGVGKTSIVANLGFAFRCLGKSVLILDADLGLGNLDVLLGLAPRYNLSHVLMGKKTISEILTDGPNQMKILPASSGIQELTQLNFDQKMLILTELDALIEDIDVLFIDTAAGISSNVMDFNVSAHEIVVVVSPEPTSITDAYALMKVLSLRYEERICRLLVNMVSSPSEGMEVYRQLEMVTSKFLDIKIEYLGCVPYDERVPRSVKRQRIVSELFPDSKASRCFMELGRKIIKTQPTAVPKGNTHFFWHHLVRGKLA